MVMIARTGAILGLPLLTIIYARGAKPIGVFGLVIGGLTNRYQFADLSLCRPCETFTNHYHRTGGDGGQGDDLGGDQTNRMGRTVKGGVVRWCGRVVKGGQVIYS